MIDLRVLGPIEVIGPEGAAILVGVKQRTLAGLLMLGAGTVQSKANLVDALWGEEAPRTAVRTLDSHICRLRSSLEDCGLPGVLPRQGAGYRLALPREAVDAHRFDDAVRRARAGIAADRPDETVAALKEGLGLWRGEMFTGGAPLGWVVAEVARLAEARLSAAEDLWEILVDRGEHAGAVPELERLTALQPLRERLAGLLMLALCRADRHAEALDRYERLRAELAGQLGVDPGTGLRQLHTAILRGEIPAVAPVAVTRYVPAQLPPPAGHFVGRGEPLEEMSAWLDKPSTTTRIVVVTGLAGIGKTALAVQWASKVAARFGDGQLFVDLQGHDPETMITAAEALAQALRSLGVPPDRMPSAVTERLGLYRSLTNGRRMLVLLDDAGTADHVLPLVPPGPAGMLVVTSRHRLTALAVHHAVHIVELGTLDDAEADALLRLIIGPERVQREPTCATDLAKLCGRIPLALRVAAARLAARPLRPISDLVTELTDDDLLDGLALEDGEYSVRTVFASAYNSLSEPAAGLFRRLGAHPGLTFGPDLAAALIAASPGRARRALDELAAANLITEIEPGRYRCHDLIRAYLRERLEAEEDPPARAEVTERLLDWYLGMAEAANSVLDPRRDRVKPALRFPPELPFPSEPGSILAYLDGEQANLAAIVAHAARMGHYQVAWQLSYLIAGYFESRGHADGRVAVYQHGLAAARRVGEPVTEGLMCSGLGVALIAARRYAQALGPLADALVLMRQNADRRGEGHVHNNIAVALGELRRWDEAITAAERALEVHSANGLLLGMILALNNLGHLHARHGRPDASLDCLSRALELTVEAGDVRMEAAVRHSTGETYRDSGRQSLALPWFERSLELRRDSGNKHYESRTLHALGRTHLQLGDPARAAALFAESGAVSQAIGDDHLRAVALAGLASAQIALADVDGARRNLDLAVQLRSRIPDGYEEAVLNETLGELECLRGRPDLARRHRAEAIRLYRKVNARAEADRLSGPPLGRDSIPTASSAARR